MNWKLKSAEQSCIMNTLKNYFRQFVNFTGIQIIGKYQREKILLYFKRLQKLDPIVQTDPFEAMYLSHIF